MAHTVNGSQVGNPDSTINLPYHFLVMTSAHSRYEIISNGFPSSSFKSYTEIFHPQLLVLKKTIVAGLECHMGFVARVVAVSLATTSFPVMSTILRWYDRKCAIWDLLAH